MGTFLRTSCRCRTASNMVLKRIIKPWIYSDNSEAEIEEKEQPRRLVPLRLCPTWLQFNKFVWSGYRCNLTSTECLDSLGYLHNESVNIYTHGVPCLFLMFIIPLTATKACLQNPFWFSFHYFSCVIPFFSSFIYHLFMCHHNGLKTYNTLLNFDMCGVWAVNAFGALCGIRASLFCFPVWRNLAVMTYLVISCASLSFILNAKTPKERFAPLAVFGLLRYMFLSVRLTLKFLGYGCGNDEALPYCLLMDTFACVGGVINIARIPEKWFPGQFDLFGNSHQIMHVLSVISVLFLHVGVTKEFEWMDTYKCLN